MKKVKQKIIMLILALFILANIPVISQAAGAFKSTISKTTVTVGDTFTITATANLAAGTYSVTPSNSNVTITSSGSGFLDKNSETWTFKAAKAGTVTITVKATDMTYSEDDTVPVTGSQSYTVTVKAKPTTNTNTNTSTGSGSGNTTGSTNSSSGNNSNSSSSTGSSGGNSSSSNSSSSSGGGNSSSSSGSSNSSKPSNGGGTSSSSGSSSSSNSSSSSSSGTTTKAPTFTAVNQTVYTTGTTNIRASYSPSSKIIATVNKGTKITRTGTGSNGWSKVSYNGQTAYISSSLLTTTKPVEEEPKKEDTTTQKSSNKYLSSLKIENVEITPVFNKEITQYTAKITDDIDKLEIKTKAEDSKSKVSIEGNEGLVEGSNVIKIKVTAEDNTTRTYFVDVTKSETTKSESEENIETTNTETNKLQLNNLSIAGVEFTNGFKPDVNSYSLQLNYFVSNLEITATPNKADAKVEIIGNENFKEGENSITILLSSADGKESATYQIKVNVPAEDTAKPEPQVIPNIDNMQFYMICGIVVIVAIFAISVIVSIYNKNKGNIDDNNNEENIDVQEEEVKAKPRKNKGKHHE